MQWPETSLLRILVKNREGWGMVFYFVQRGETLYTIAKRYQTTVHAIVVANRLEDPNAICPGQALIIPRPGEVPSPPPGGIVHLVRSGETVFHLAGKFGTSPQEILRANQIAHPEFILAGQQLVIPERMEVGDDWPMVGRAPGRSGAGPVVLEGVPTAGWSYRPRRAMGIRPSAPVIRYDRVYVGLGDGQFYSLDRQSGRVKWRVPAAGSDVLAAMGEQPLAAPAVFDGLAYLCGPDGSIFAVDAYAGHSIWKTVIGGTSASSPAVQRGVVFVGAGDGHLYALEAKTGAVVWRQQVGAPLLHPVALGDDHVYAVAANGVLWALDAESGQMHWQAPADPAGSPVFAEVVVLCGGSAYDPADGSLLWQVDAGGTSPVARLDRVFYPGGVVDLFTGSLQVAHVAGPCPPVSIPPAPFPLRAHVATGPLLIGVGHDNQLHGMDAEDGHAVWSVALSGSGHQPPAVAPGQVVITLLDGSVRTYRFGPA
jgi:outer membrane protein assembly factor BamB